MTINEETKQTTNEYLDKIKELELRTKSDLEFLVDGAIKSAKLEIALAEMTHFDTTKMSELAQNIQKYPNFDFHKQVVFGEYMTKPSTTTSDFVMVDEEELNTKPFDSNKTNEQENDNTNSNGTKEKENDGSGIDIEVPEKKKHSQVRRTRIPLVSVKLDECELFVSVARLTQLDEKRKVQKPDYQKSLDDFTK